MNKLLVTTLLTTLIVGTQAMAADLQVETRTRVRVNLPMQTLANSLDGGPEGSTVQGEVVPVPPAVPPMTGPPVAVRPACVEARVINIQLGEALVIREGPSQETLPMGIIGPDYPVLVCGGFQGWARVRVCSFNPPAPCTEGWSSLRFLAPVGRVP